MDNNVQQEEQNEVAGQNVDCNDPDSAYVKLLSEEVFFIQKKYAIMAGIIKTMLTGPGQFIEYRSNEINLNFISAKYMSYICQYLVYKYKYTHGEIMALPFEIDPKDALELLFVANYLDC